MPDPATVTVAFSVHYPETVALAAPHMRGHDIIVLEEPRIPGFEDMLAGALPIDDYLLATDFEFPAFARLTCELLRGLHAEGKAILQVEPYLEALYAVQERFAEGGSPQDIPEGTLERAVYKAERVWSGALLAYYRASMGGTFEQAVEAVKLFGRADAARGRLRDDLRAQAVARLVVQAMAESSAQVAAKAAGASRRIYLEAGYVHVSLLGLLRRRLPPGVAVEPLYLLEPVVRDLTGKRQHLGPGDILTLTYVYRPDYEGERADLQAARSMIRAKILSKEEATENLGSFPQTREEVEASRLVRALSFEECKTLFGHIRRRSTAEARDAVAGFVRDKERTG